MTYAAITGWGKCMPSAVLTNADLAARATSMDINTACTSFMYGLSTATAMIRTGVVKNALVAAAIPVSLVEALEDGRVAPDELILMPAFGAGLTWSSHLVRWGKRTPPLGTSDVELRRPTLTALERVRELIAIKQPPNRSDAGLAAARLAEDF